MKNVINVFCILFVFVCFTAKASDENISLTQDQVRQSLIETLNVLNEVYVLPEKAKVIESVILERINQGDYDQIKSTKAFQKVITTELREVSTDGHLGILLVKNKEDEPTHVLTETEDEYKNNYAFQKVEILKGNVGYLKFNKFYQDEEALETVKHAFGMLKDTDAMIIDLRDNIGGSPELVRHIASYFIEDKTLLWRYHTRGDENIYDNESDVGIGPINFKSDYPLYVLIGPETASAAEVFSYTLKHLSKAVLVGERTMGIAHAVGAVKINEYFIGRFSMGRPVNPITHSYWELVGVMPDIESNSKSSLKKAHALALKFLNNK